MNGHHIQRQVKRAIFESETAYKDFVKSRLKFESQTNLPSLDELHAKVVKVNDRLARLKTVQDFYNAHVTVDAGPFGKISLAEALNRESLAGQEAKLWRLAAEADVEVARFSRLGDIEKVREKDKEYAVRAAPRDHCMAQSALAEDKASALREAVATGNLVRIDTLESGPFLLDYLKGGV